MKKKIRPNILIGILIFSFSCISASSCQSKKVLTSSESVFFTDSIYSNHLSEYRKHNIYLPRKFDKDQRYPILYATDGYYIEEENSFYKRTLDSLIEHRIIRPLILIVSHCNNKIVDSTSVTTENGGKVYLSLRNFEYINDYSSTTQDSSLAKRFRNHMLYFKNELIPSVEKKYNQKIKKEDRYFYGVSNGAGFGISMLYRYPNTIGTFLCFSIFGGDIQSNNWKENVNYPKIYLQYGSEEYQHLKKDAEFLKSKYSKLNLFAEINEFEGGHDYKIWCEKFIEVISRILATE